MECRGMMVQMELAPYEPIPVGNQLQVMLGSLRLYCDATKSGIAVSYQDGESRIELARLSADDMLPGAPPNDIDIEPVMAQVRNFWQRYTS